MTGGIDPGERVALDTDGRVEVTRLGFGGAPLGNLFRAIPEGDAEAAIQAAFDAGARFFDTAPQYGLGRSEDRISRVLERIGRSNVTLSTKVGRLLLDCEPHEVTPEAFVDVPQRRIVFDYSYDGVTRSLEDSARRMRGMRPDVVFVHDIGADTQGSREASDARIAELFDEGGYRALRELRDTGEIGAIGAGVNEWHCLDRLLDRGDFDAFLLAGRYTLLEQTPLDTFFPRCEERGVGIVVGGPLNSGILAVGPDDPAATYDYDRAPPDIVKRVRGLDRVCRAHGVPLIAAALQFPLAHPVVRSVIPGGANAREVRENAEMLAHPIPAALWSDLRSEGLIRSDAPVPGEG